MNTRNMLSAIRQVGRPLILTLIIFALTAATSFAQSKLTKEQIMNMSIEELSDLPLEDLMEAVETLGVSSVDELFAMIMNKNVASASKKEESSFTAPLSTTTITRNELRTYGATTIEEAFRLVPGMVVQEKTNGMYDVYIRGLNNIPDGQRSLYAENTNTLMMVDGRIINDYMCGMIPWESLQISIEDVERIEVVRGATSALYGQNAVQGVINIITDKQNSAHKTVQGSVQMGNMHTIIGDVALRTDFSEKLNLGLTFNIQQRNRRTDKIYVPANSNYFVNTTPSVNPNTDPSGLKPISEGMWLTRDEVANSYTSLLGQYYKNVEETTPIEWMFPDLDLARKNMGVNGYLSFNPNENIGVNLTTGFQKSNVNSSSIDDDIFVMGGREFKNFYANLQSHLYGVTFNMDMANGAGNKYVRGVHSYTEGETLIGSTLSYDIELDNLSIRPEVQYHFMKARDKHYFDTYPNGTPDGQIAGDYAHLTDGSYVRITPFFNGKGTTTYTIAPSLRLDYKLDSWRFIGAFRTDKTDKPDKWNNSWQLAVSKLINDKNFIRISYGRATRASVIINSDANYTWTRHGMSQPSMVNLFGTDGYDLVTIDNVELGYRWRPTSNILLDAELFYSFSENYGSLRATSANIYISQSNMINFVQEYAGAASAAKNNFLANNAAALQAKYMQEAIANGKTNPAEIQAYVTDRITADATAAVTETLTAKFDGGRSILGLNSPFTTVATMKYGNVPYKVKQMGLSLNMDWIVSPKLIAKFNVNVQNTKMDDYYFYDQKAALSKQLNAGAGNVVDVTKSIISDMSSYKNGEGAQEYFANLLVSVSEQTMAVANSGKYGSPEEFGAYCHQKFMAGESVDGVPDNELLSAFYMYNLNVRKLSGEDAYAAGVYNQNVFRVGREANVDYELENDHKHEATPNVYGMVGLIYKPVKQVTVTAFGNFIGERTYNLAYGTLKMDPRFTVNMKLGYTPINGLELFFNAHNLFNSVKQEYPGMDNIGGLYTFGVNFGF